MKAFLTLVAIAIATVTWAQAPEGINYQAVARDGQGSILPNANLNVQFSIHSGTATGTIEYKETHFVSTNNFGLFDAVIGAGNTVTGSFSGLDWGSNKYFLQVEVDPGGGMVDLGTTQLVSVPYALYSKEAGSGWPVYQGGSGITVSGSTITNTAPDQAVTLTGSGATSITGSYPNFTINSTDNVDDADANPSNELQSLSLVGSDLTISQGNTVSLPGSNSPWSVSGNDIYYNTGNVGIGVSPKTTLHIGDGQRVLFGADTMGSGDKLMWLPDLHAFRVGTISTGAASSYWDRDSIGSYSFASGFNSRAQGFGGTALGRDVEAQGSYSFASGYFSNANGQYSTAMGFNTDALGLGSTAIGYSTDAEENYSFSAGYFSEAQAIYSVAIGYAVQAQSYSSMAIGRYNVGGGSATSWNSSDPIFEIGIGTSNSNRANAITVRKDGNVGIGTTVPLAALQVNGQVRFASVEYFEDGGTNEIAARGDIRPSSDNTYDLGTSSFRWDDVYATNGTIQTSDIRDKKDIEDIPYGLQDVLALRPVRYAWKNDPLDGKKLGLIAQDLLEVIPEVVKTEDFKQDEETEELIPYKLDRLGVYYSDLIPVLVKALQEENQKVEVLEQKLAELEERLQLLEQ